MPELFNLHLLLLIDSVSLEFQWFYDGLAEWRTNFSSTADYILPYGKKNQYTDCSILKPYEEQDDIRMTAREGHVIPKQKFNKI